jgi:hypothetical protein
VETTMRWWTWLTLATLACSGDGGGDDTGDDDDDDGNDTDVDVTPGGDIVIDCDDVPQHNVDGMDCEQTWSALLQVSAASRLCNDDSDCRVQRLNCESWVQADCYLLFNYCIDKEEDVDVGKYMEHGGDTLTCEGDDGDVCTCGSALDVQCVDHYCQWVYE